MKRNSEIDGSMSAGASSLERFKRELEPSIYQDDRITTTQFSYDATNAFHLPAAVVRPRSVAELEHVVRMAAQHRVVIVPRGAGTGFSGGALGSSSSVILDLLGLARIIEIDEADMTAWVEPGVITRHFQNAVEKRSLYYPPDPASLKTCTLGGNVAENAGGPHCLKYGVTRDYVMAISGITGDGRSFIAGKAIHKNRAGYDLRHLLIGSEGTLAVFTGFRLKLLGKPETRILISAYFAEYDLATATVNRLLEHGITPSSLEFMDQTAIMAVDRLTCAGLPTQHQALLLIEVDGRFDEMKTLQAKVQEILSPVANEIRVALDHEEQERLWEIRRKASPAMRAYGNHKTNEDIVVPRKCIPEAIREIRAIADRHRLKIITFGHIGDGNLHVNIMSDAADRAETQRVEEGVADLFALINRLEGAISGEHGIGLSKRAFLPGNIDAVSLDLMRSIKRDFDPYGILNPGKIFVPERER